MTAIPKHEATGRKGKKPLQPAITSAPAKVVLVGPESSFRSSEPMQHEVNYVDGMGGIEESLDWIAKGIGRLTSDDHTVGVAVSQNLYGNPIRLALCTSDGGDMTDRVVEALERIADSVAKLAGLSRPRLESWHEQDEYEPRFKKSAVDGGAPGPKKADG